MSPYFFFTAVNTSLILSVIVTLICGIPGAKGEEGSAGMSYPAATCTEAIGPCGSPKESRKSAAPDHQEHAGQC